MSGSWQWKDSRQYAVSSRQWKTSSSCQLQLARKVSRQEAAKDEWQLACPSRISSLESRSPIYGLTPNASMASPTTKCDPVMQTTSLGPAWSRAVNTASFTWG
jgi:hypothetical protein